MKRVLSLVLALVMVFGTIMPAFAEDAATIAADSQAATDLVSYGVIAGTDKGLEEASVLTRAQMTVILSQLYGKKAEAEAYAFAPSFTDVAEGKWYTPYVAFAEQQGWMSGDAAGGTFRPDDVMKAQEVNAMFVKALGYTVEWADVNTKAEELEVAITAADTTSVLRGEAFAALRAMLDVPKMDETDTLGTALALTNYVAPTPAAPEAVAVTAAVSLNEKVFEVSLDSDLDAPTAVTVDQFVVTDKDAAAVAVASVEFAPWDADNYTVLVTLETATVAGTLYTVTSGEATANFGGLAADTAKATVTKMEATDYNEVEVTFSEAVMISDLTFVLAEKYGTKAELAVTNVVYAAKDKVVLTTADQKAATLYTSTINGAVDLAGNVMKEDTAQTFVGLAKPTAKQSLKEIKAATSTKVEVYFNQKVDEAVAADAANYTVAMKYGDKTEVAVVSAEVVAKTTTKAQHVLLTLATDTTAATLYNVTVTNVGSIYGTVLAADQAMTFVGLAKDTTKLGTPVLASTSNTKMTMTFGTADEKDYVNEATTADMFTITEKYGDKAELAVTEIAIKKNVITFTTAAQKAATLYEVKIATGILDVAGNATTAEITTTFVGSGIATKISDITSATLDSAGTTLTVVFNKAVDKTQAVDISHYVIDNGVGYPTKAVMDSTDTTNKTVKLTVPKTTEGKLYKLTVTNLNNSDGVAMDAKGISETFVGKGTAATLPQLEAVQAIDEQTLKLYFDRDVTDSTIAGQIYNSTTKVLIDDAIQIIADGGTAADYDLFDKVEKVYTDSAEKNALFIRLTTAEFEAADLTNSATVFKVLADATKVYSTSSANVKEFANNEAAVSAPTIEAVQAMNVRTIRVYFSAPIEDISVAANFTPSTFKLYTDEDGTTVVKNAAGTDVAVDAVYKIDNKTFELRLDNDLATSTNATNGQAYLYIASAGATGLTAVEATKIQDPAQVVELAQDSTSKAFVSRLFGFSSTTITADSITDVNPVMIDKRTIKVYFPEAMAAAVTTVGNYAIVKDSTGTAQVGTVGINYIDYNSTDNTAMLYLDKDIAADNYLAVKGTLTNESGLQNIKDEDTSVAVVTSGLVRQFAPSEASPAKPSIASASINDDRNEITVVFDQEVAFGAAMDFANNVAADDVLTTASLTFASGNAELDKVVNAFKLTATRADGTAIAAEVLDDTGALSPVTNVVRNKDNKTVVITLDYALKADTSAEIKLNEAASQVVTWTNTTNEETAADVSKATIGIPATSLHPTDTTAPTVAITSTGDDDGAVAAAETLIVTFGEAMIPTAIDATNIDTVLAVNNSHSHLDGAGAVTSAVWSVGNTVLTITYSAGTSIPTVASADTITFTLVDVAGNVAPATAIGAGEF
ncbi:MAG: hypothetical protein JEZ08_18310 [Clostridiales bacterium]|nr:hypothetical protein [Clostridiales bacterium]